MNEEIRNSLPDRRLRIGEIESVLEDFSTSVRVFPAVVLATIDDHAVPVIHVEVREDGQIRYYGYAGDTAGWESVDSWSKEATDRAEITETIRSWASQHFGEEFEEHGYINIDWGYLGRAAQ